MLQHNLNAKQNKLMSLGWDQHNDLYLYLAKLQQQHKDHPILKHVFLSQCLLISPRLNAFSVKEGIHSAFCYEIF